MNSLGLVFDKLTSSKFVMTVGGCAVFTFLLWHGKISQETYQFLVSAFTGSFLAANTTQNVFAIKSNAKAEQKPDEKAE